MTHPEWLRRCWSCEQEFEVTERDWRESVIKVILTPIILCGDCRRVDMSELLKRKGIDTTYFDAHRKKADNG